MEELIIVDISIWIDFFRGLMTVRARDAFTALLESRQIVQTDIIRHELLVGANHERQFREIEELLSPIRVLSISPVQWEEFTRFGFNMKQRGLLGRFTDLSIAYLAQQCGYPVWSTDRYFFELGRKKIIQLFSP